MKERLDILLVDRRLVESRNKAQWLIRNRKVLVEGKIVDKPGRKIDNRADLELIEQFPYVGKGGLKLEKALKEFSIIVKDKICVDIGASIGGFTDCLLKQKAKKVYAIDTATDLLHPSLLCEKMQGKVVPLLGTDAREVKHFPDPIDICTIDITFASLRDVLPVVKSFLIQSGMILALVKPLFETEFHNNKKFNIIEDQKELYKILIDLYQWAENNELFAYGIIKSPLKGKGGSTEFFYYFKIDERSELFNIREKLDQILQ